VTVYLVGAGPGDPGLLTLRAAELLSRAEVVVHDRLVDRRVLAMAPASALLVDVGKRSGASDGALAQEEINALLVELASRRGPVVRLKGGDPYVLGRGGEEAIALGAAGVDYQVVPGLSSAVAVPSYAGVPVTHRGVASGFVVVTGHDAGAPASTVDWGLLAASTCTIVVLMGAATRDAIARRLVDGGRAASTPVLVVENGTMPDQRSLRTTLGGLAALEVTSPATIVVGEAAALTLASYEERPLFGWRVVVTRPAAQSAALAGPLADAGALPVELPLIEIRAPRDGGAALRCAASRLDSYDWVVLTSANAVERLLGEVRDARAFGLAKIAAIGPSTAGALRRHGIVADLVPQAYVGEALVEAFPAPSKPVGEGGRVLLARAAVARDVVPDGLAALGWQLEIVEAYETVHSQVDSGALDAVALADAVTFTSPSTVEAFVELAGLERLPPIVASIGPVTTAAASAAGMAVDAQARQHTAEGLVEALVHYARDRRGKVRRRPG
jgi:uroporphyrinogen III methyltransferase/synthase